ncbi:hypothetical protein LZG04_11405 [Saccharothrix sp. S26]|uniref:hypothetical protein n=1 Tax=Saccharothrix sp. S26 TaxID=2907215 RepID=UPI001F1F69AF|nr:hypothetical protein [Saccharothrix sp. S26]MCE6995408.1 hypothetical protein [Saccharothrix sp. S26]
MATSSGGGSAAAGGFRFEIQVGALLAAHVVTGTRLPTSATRPWPRTAGWLTHVGLQAGYPVDDIVAFTDNEGFIAVQAKKGLKLGRTEESPLAQALEQAVRMFRRKPPGAAAEPGTEREWNPTIDRIVIATDTDAPEPIRRHLVTVVNRLATAPPSSGEEQLANSAGERTALAVFTGHVRRLWRQQAGSEIAREDLRAFCSVLRVMAFDLQPGGRDLQTVHAMLGRTMTDASQVDTAWRSLLVTCENLSADRTFTNAQELRGELAADGLDCREILHPPDEAGPVFAPDAVLHGPLADGALRDRLAEADKLSKSDPRAAARRYKSVMADLQTDGYLHQAAGLQPQLTRALRASGQHDAAMRAAVAAAWGPVRRGEVPSQFPDEFKLVDELRHSPNARARVGTAVYAVLRYEAGDMSLPDAAERVAAVRDDDEFAGELLLWLAEEAIAAGLPELFESLGDRALGHAAAAPDEAAEFAGRVRIAVAECRRDWSPLLASVEADCGPELYVLARARHGQALARGNDLAGAVENYEQAVAAGTRERMYAEVRTWLYDLRNLRFALGGPGMGYETHHTAQSLPRSHKLTVFEGKEQLLARGLEALASEQRDRAHRVFMRLRHRMSTGAALANQRQCDTSLGDALGDDNVPLAVDRYLRGTEHKKATALLRQQPDTELVPEQAWVDGPVWQARAAYEFLGAHGDLVAEQHARELFEKLEGRLITTGPIRGWATLGANETLLTALAALVWASPRDAAGRLLARLAPVAGKGGLRRSIESHVDLLLGCARVHPDLVADAAHQFSDLLCVTEKAVSEALDRALELLSPAKEYLVERLSRAVETGEAPWLMPVLGELEVRTPVVVEHANAALEAAAKPRTYTPGSAGFGSDLVSVAGLSHLGAPDRRDRFVAAMLDIALEPRELNVERREAIDAIAAVAQRCGAASLDTDLRATILQAVRPIAGGQGVGSDEGLFPRRLASPKELVLAANRLLVILAPDEQERDRIARNLLLTLMDGDIENPRLLQSALAQAPADTFKNDLLALAASRSPSIRAFAAHCWAEIDSGDEGIGRRLASDPAGVVRLALAHGLTSTARTDIDDIREVLSGDCRFTVRAEIQHTRPDFTAGAPTQTPQEGSR